MSHRTDRGLLSIGEEEEGEYDGARERNELEIEKTKDPALGYIPADRLLNAIRYTDNLKKARLKDATALTWTERGRYSILLVLRMATLVAVLPIHRIHDGRVSGYIE
jgi:hypothetical protein